MNNTRRYEILYILSLEKNSLITFRDPFNNQRPRCDIEMIHATNNLHHSFINNRYAFDHTRTFTVVSNHVNSDYLPSFS
jgi:hypothetical protein